MQQTDSKPLPSNWRTRAKLEIGISWTKSSPVFVDKNMGSSSDLIIRLEVAIQAARAACEVRREGFHPSFRASNSQPHNSIPNYAEEGHDGEQ